ncbi:glycoside hydrolase family 3 protein [Ornithinicoccus hortensis]|uniref:beta-N-acetylhexosaminidase n=1 Tax=Ornithinicoccus hortensis TaxID=82346 RepID=A0A542YQ17_9MICO|nr:glycoside hydrolase family 3 N-terminal domain-containing protein [Ornithinicoccus hortensis]TQL50203.1 beta-N-acetylhexosaminidase [Ornithinicoccus hortensis]
MTRPLRLLVPLVVLGVLAAGCAGSGDADRGAGSGPTPAPTTPTGEATGDSGAGATAEPPDGETTSGPGEDTSTGTSSGGEATDAPPAISGRPSPEELDRARREVSELSLEELAGQLVVASYGGTDAQGAADLVGRYHLAGVITLGDNVPEDPEQRVGALQDLTAAVDGAVAADGRDWPAFLGIDQEGGPITRVGAPLPRWPSGMALGAAGDPGLAHAVAAASGEQVRALGYTVVFAPVADVTSGPDDPTIAARSPGADPVLVAEIAGAQADGYADAGLVPVAKHFPGHGSVTADTHLGSAVQDADLATLRARDLVPFEALADQGIPAMMTAHIEVQALDPGRPATLSEPVLTGLLRDDLGFDGLIITDALNMGAIVNTYGTGDAAVLAVQAGADVLLMPADPGAATAALVGAVQDGTLERERLEESAARVVATLRQGEEVPAPDPGVIGSGHDLAVAAAAASITQLDGTCGDRLVGDAIQVVGGTETDRARLAAAAEQAGLGTGSGDVVALVGAPTYQAGGGGGGTDGVTGDVVVALDVPYPLAASTARTARLAAYGRDEATFEALVRVLLGEAEAAGQLPVPVGDLPIGSGCD